MSYSFRKVEQPPRLIRLVLGRSPIMYNWLRSGRLGSLVTSVITSRKILAFNSQNLTIDLPSQFKEILHEIPESALSATQQFKIGFIRTIDALCSVGRRQRSLQGVVTAFTALGKLSHFPVKDYPML